MSFLSKEASVARPGYSRWLIPPAALCVHLCIGQVYALSVFKVPLEHHFNASHTAIGWIFSLAIAMLGTSSAIFGTWVERNGPRKAMVVSAACWSSGFLIGSLGIATHQLWLLYLGYGFIGGIGLGIGYISPVSTLMKWFPERPGLATGMAIMGFGGGALFAAPFSTFLMERYDPSFNSAVDGSYAAGSAVWKTYLTLGIIYAIVMLIGAALVRIPRGFEDDDHAGHIPGHGGALVRTSKAVRTPQFYFLWIILFCNVTAGIGILENAGPMIQDFFREGGETPVTAGMAAGFVGLLSLANMSGRFVWSSLSDKIGRKPAYVTYLGGGLLLYLTLAQLGSRGIALFVTTAFLILTFYGGGFATIPAYLKDLFGTLEVGAIHGRLLTAWSAAGIAGPLIINSTLDKAGVPGTLQASDYTSAFMVMVGILGVGFIANLLVRTVPARYHEPNYRERHLQRMAAASELADKTSGGQ
ncbi:MAG TPA: OFA family MFS transporter [Actinomycetaceae bacterium]|nr:OFA family MFS transporter [Actinomycetaceae bacterium]